MNRMLGLGLALGFSILLVGCGSESDSEGSGRAQFTVWGEEFIEDELPASEFADGWSVEFEKFLIVIGDVSVNDSRGGKGAGLPGSRLFDLVAPGPQPLGSVELRARAWDRVGYSVLAADSSTERAESATQQDLELMQDAGSSVYVTGAAARDDELKTFAWGFGNTTRYGHCVSVSAGREVPGVVVPNGGEESVELTIHGDHFFYDDLASDDAMPRFDAIASADSDGDGEVTLDELRAVKLVSIPEGTYGTGSASHVDDLGAFVSALTTTLGHFRGEGHCEASAE